MTDSDPCRRLPQLQGQRLVTDGGIETDLIFHHGLELPHFAAFPLMETAHGREVLTGYYDDYAAIADRAGVGLMLESPTWRANPDWGYRLGHPTRSLAAINHAAIELLIGLRERYAFAIPEIVISGTVGPRGDGYRPGPPFDPDDAARYHRPQLETFANAGADMATAYTLTDIGEAVGIVRASRDVGLPVAISFTVETDGRLASGRSLAEAIAAVDRVARPEYFLLNCAHPSHIAPGLVPPGPWLERIVGTRANASLRSHAELDDATDLDEGDPQALASAQRQLTGALPNLTIIGGCCGTDARHVAAIWGVN